MEKDKVALITILVAFLGFIAGGVCWYVIPHVPLAYQICFGVGFVALIAYVFVERSTFKESLAKRTTQYGLNSIALALIAIGVVTVINMIANNYDKKIDITKNKLHTLSEQSVKVVQGLTNPVTIRAFVDPQVMNSWKQVFEKYSYVSEKVKGEFIDLDKDPTAVQRYGIKSPETLVVESGERVSRVEKIGPDDARVEEKITNAIISVTKGDKKKILWVSGHGEHLPSDAGKDGYSATKDDLENSRYKIEEVVLLEKEKIPADTEIVVIAGPKSEFMDGEVKMLEAYLKTGGKMMVMLEPTSGSSLRPLLAKYGIAWTPHKAVYEVNPLQKVFGGNPLTPIVKTYSPHHEITRETQQMSFFPLSTPIEKAKEVPADYKAESLFSTSPESFEAELKGNNLNVDPKTNRKGPLSLAVAVSGSTAAPADPKKPEGDKATEKKEDEKKSPEFRLLVVGDSDFGGNIGKRYGVNSDLFQNMVSWLAQEEDLIAVRPKPTDSSELDITEARYRVILLASSVFMPLLMLIFGFAMWLHRRRK